MSVFEIVTLSAFIASLSCTLFVIRHLKQETERIRQRSKHARDQLKKVRTKIRDDDYVIEDQEFRMSTQDYETYFDTDNAFEPKPQPKIKKAKFTSEYEDGSTITLEFFGAESMSVLERWPEMSDYQDYEKLRQAEPISLEIKLHIPKRHETTAWLYTIEETEPPHQEEKLF